MQTATIPAVIDVERLGELMDERPDVRVLDVRTPGEYESVHIRGGYNVPLDLLGEHAREIRENVEEPVVLVCQSGGRARKAREALSEAGCPTCTSSRGAWGRGWRPASRSSAGGGASPWSVRSG
ncbi:rhodanese-like domain-containing protein [Rubrobacter marinus]|uniref:rhodanese-like domain-containing protein n=1 Tax=Rubrobacter marinus TaxID=2653852 RepID=UPI001A9F2F2F